MVFARRCQTGTIGHFLEGHQRVKEYKKRKLKNISENIEPQTEYALLKKVQINFPNLHEKQLF